MTSRKESKKIKKLKYLYSLVEYASEKVIVENNVLGKLKEIISDDFIRTDGDSVISPENFYKIREYRAELDYYNRYYWDHRGCLSSYYIKKEYFNTLTEVKNTDCKEILRCFDKTAIFINNKLYTDNEGLEFLKEIEEEHKPFVIKGTDWPYWFKIDGLLCHSETSNYFLFLDHEYDYLAESSLEEYNGPDKYSEHKNKEE